jgi:hypothetical protein
MHEFVVPKSMPSTFAIAALLALSCALSIILDNMSVKHMLATSSSKLISSLSR